MKRFELIVNDNDETGVDFNALVDVPAHLKSFIAFGKDQKQYSFSDEKRIVTGVMIAADVDIYRNDRQFGEHTVRFTAETIDKIRKKFFKNGFVQNLNEMHNKKNKVQGAVLIDSFIINNSDPRFPNTPEIFEDQKLNDGSWIASYHITDDATWAKVKDGTFNGFSVEGLFEKVEIKTKVEMKQNKRTILEMMGITKSKETFAEATTVDGVTVFYEGELAEGTLVQVIVDGEMQPAPEGDHEIMLSETEKVVITLDAAGVITAVEALEAEAAAADEDLKAEVAEAMKTAIAGVVADYEAKFEALEAKFNAIVKGEKFEHKGKKTGEQKVSSWKTIVNNK
jgi:hypothetical protein